MRSTGDEGRQRSEPGLLARGRHPRRPFFQAADLGDAAPRHRLFADGDAVADGFAVRQHVIEKLVVGIDDDGAGGFLAVIVDDVPLVGVGNDRLIVRQIRHQLFVARLPPGLGRRLDRPLHAAAERHSDNYKCQRTHCHNLPTLCRPSRELTPRDSPKSHTEIASIMPALQTRKTEVGGQVLQECRTR